MDEATAVLIGAVAGALVAGALNVFGGLWASRREVLRQARVDLFVNEIQPMMDAVRAGAWDDDDTKVAPLLRKSWLLTRGDRRYVRRVNAAAEALASETDPTLKAQRRVALVEALRVVQRRTARRIR